MYKYLVPMLVSLGCAEQAVVVPVDAAPPEISLSVFGGPCEQTTDCATGVCETDWVGVEMPGGLCTEPCVWGTACDEGVCVGNNDSSQEGFCWPPCDGPSDCREGWVCAWFFTSFCAPEETVQ